MDTDDYGQYSLPAASLGDQSLYLPTGQVVTLLVYDDQPLKIDLPKHVALKVIEATMAVKGDTTNQVLKDVSLETGLIVKAPHFIQKGDIISVDTLNGSYRERQKANSNQTTA